MVSIEITRLAREDLRELIETRHLPDDARERVSRSLLTLREFPRAGKKLSGVCETAALSSVRGAG